MLTSRQYVSIGIISYLTSVCTFGSFFITHQILQLIMSKIFKIEYGKIKKVIVIYCKKIIITFNVKIKEPKTSRHDKKIINKNLVQLENILCMNWWHKTFLTPWDLINVINFCQIPDELD